MSQSIKISLIGPRYTGKGQIGRAWARTEADLPTLQPVILYEKEVARPGKQAVARVVTWVMSYDPEFENIRKCFLRDVDGIVFTVNHGPTWKESLGAIEGYIEEYFSASGRDELPPNVVAMVKLAGGVSGMDDESEMERSVASWARDHGAPAPFKLDHSSKDVFDERVESMVLHLLTMISTPGSRHLTR